MGYVLFGHGGLTPGGAAKMEVCAMGAGTTIQFYADAGQELLQASSLLDMFASLQKPWDPLDSTKVTYNLQLSPFSQAEHDALTSTVQDWGGHTLLTIGTTDIGCDPVLCTGDETTCPKDPRMITGAVPGPRTHTCTGILNRYAGQELYWVACTAIVGFDAQTNAVVDAARGDAPKQVLIGEDPDNAVANALKYAADYPDAFPGWFDGLPAHEQEVLLRDPGLYAWDQGRKGTAAAAAAPAWAPSGDDLANVSAGNQAYVKEGAEDFDHPWESGGALVLLGDEHDQTFHDWVRQAPDHASGTFQVKRATFGAGKIVFSGVPMPLQGTVESMVEGFSDKKIVFE